MQRRLRQWRRRGGDHRLRDRSDGYLCCQWRSAVFCYGVGPNSEGEGSISIYVAVEFQFNSDFRVTDAVNAEGSDRDTVDA